MLLLIDGHNLIGQMPDIDLADPHDEAKLVLRLRRYRAHTGHRITVVFDGGIPAGWSANLSTGGVEVVFAGERKTADAVIVGRIRRHRDPRSVVVVSTDRAVAEAARRRGARVIPATAFARELTQLGSAPEPEVGDEDLDVKDVVLSPQEIEDWLELFQQAKNT